VVEPYILVLNRSEFDRQREMFEKVFSRSYTEDEAKAFIADSVRRVWPHRRHRSVEIVIAA